jgi:hypothetical protein
MTNESELGSGTQTFEHFFKSEMIYVDKTMFLAKMIGSPTKTWFLSRPRRFGKSLTVSTFKSIFLRKKNKLFEGLAIFDRLTDKKFAPRPVIHLDMSSLTMSDGLDNFIISLKEAIVRQAKNQGLELSKELPPNVMFNQLIEDCYYLKKKKRLAVLIDEYDTPVTDLLDSPTELEKVRKVLLEFYRQLKVCDKFLSFFYVTWITNTVLGGLYSAFNNPTDISMDTDYGAMTGFTQEEIERYYARELTDAAKARNVSKETLLIDLKEYYGSYRFDGETPVYNPVSTQLFLLHKKFDNFWFHTGTPEQLILNSHAISYQRSFDLTWKEITETFLRLYGLF